MIDDGLYWFTNCHVCYEFYCIFCSIQKWGAWKRETGLHLITLDKYDLRANLTNVYFNVASISHPPFTRITNVSGVLPSGYIVRKSKTRTTNVVRNAGCAHSRYTLKLSLKLFLMN